MAGKAAGPLFPIDPLRTIAHPNPTQTGGLSHSRTYVAEISERCGVALTTVQRWAKHGVPMFQADCVAVEFGYHPCELWPNYHHQETP